MSWGTIFTAEIYLIRESYNNLYQLEEEIDHVEKTVQNIRERIMMYCACGVQGCNTKDCEDNDVNPIDALHKEIVDLLEYYDEQQTKLYKLLLLKEDWDEVEQKFKTAEMG